MVSSSVNMYLFFFFFFLLLPALLPWVAGEKKRKYAVVVKSFRANSVMYHCITSQSAKVFPFPSLCKYSVKCKTPNV